MFKPRRRRVTVMRAWARTNVLTLVLIVFILFSTLLSALSFASIYQLRQIVRGHLEAAVTKVGEARRQTVHYDFPVQQSFPVRATVPLNESLDVPINMTVPIRERINVPVDVPVLGRIELPVDLDFDVPVSTTVTVAIDRDIPIATDIDLNTTIPLDIDLGQAPLGDVLRDLEETLRELLEQL